MGVIYVVDSSDHKSLERSKQTFGAIMSNDLLMGKPFLILSNKQDLPTAIDALDICDFFEVEYLANLFRTPCYVEGVGKYEDTFDSNVSRAACGWLIKTICRNFKSIQNKIRFLRVVTQNETHESSNEEIPRKNRRPVTGKRKVSVKLRWLEGTLFILVAAACYFWNLIVCVIKHGISLPRIVASKEFACFTFRRSFDSHKIAQRQRPTRSQRRTS